MNGLPGARLLAEVTLKAAGLTCSAAIWQEADDTLGASLRAERDSQGAGRIDTEGHADMASLQSCFKTDLIGRAVSLGWAQELVEKLLHRATREAEHILKTNGNAWDTQKGG